jgi:spoIIIJ-associated protein
MTDFDDPITSERDEQTETDAAESEASQNGGESVTASGEDLEDRLVAEGEIAGDYL